LSFKLFPLTQPSQCFFDILNAFCKFKDNPNKKPLPFQLLSQGCLIFSFFQVTAQNVFVFFAP